ncbi:hypothetical protein BDW71DRAFT_202580 [Aspergillus fruticulosus]
MGGFKLRNSLAESGQLGPLVDSNNYYKPESDYLKPFLSSPTKSDHSQNISFSHHHRKWNEARCDLRNRLQFKLLPHFALPGNEAVTSESKRGVGAGEDEDKHLNMSCKAGLAHVKIQSGEEDPVIYSMMLHPIIVLGMDDREHTIQIPRTLVSDKPYISIPRGKLSSANNPSSPAGSANATTARTSPWAMLLHHGGKDGRLRRAPSIDFRVGCTIGGAVVCYADGSHANCGPARNERSQPHHCGGHASERYDLLESGMIAKS